MSGSFIAMLGEWIGGDVTVVNPESYKSTALGKGLTFQTYTAKLEQVGEDWVKLTFRAKKGEAETSVEQLIPVSRIKRVSIWGDEKIVHL